MRVMQFPCRPLTAAAIFVAAALLGWPAALSGDGADGARLQAPRGTKGHAGAADTLGAELLRVQQQIRDASATLFRERKSIQDRLAELAAEKKAAGRAIAALKERQAKLGEELKKRREELEKRRKFLADNAGFVQAIRARLNGYLDSVKAQIESGIPWRKGPRLETVSQVRQIVNEEKQSLSLALAAVGRVQQEEEALGRLVEASALQIQVGSRQNAVNGFHLGLLAVVFANDDGSVSGWAGAGESLEQGIRDGEGAATAADGYMVAVDILRRRRSPALVELLVPKLPVALAAPPASSSSPSEAKKEEER